MEKQKKIAPPTFPKILIPAPPKGHTSCLVCFDKFEDFHKHVESRQHKESSWKNEFKDDYALIDKIGRELK